jgi:hypothetical protein
MASTSDDNGRSTLPDHLVPEISDGHGYSVRLRDLRFLGVSEDAVNAWRSQKSPLGLSPIQYQGLVRQLREALKRDGVPIGDCDIRLKGSSATFFSGAHKPMPRSIDEMIELFRERRDRVPYSWEVDEIKHRLAEGWISDGDYPSRRPFDSMYCLGIEREPSDIDLQISCDELKERCENRLIEIGQSPTQARLNNPAYSFLRHDLVDAVAPELYVFSLRMADALGRRVGVAVFPSEGPPDVSSTHPELSSHLTSDDWIIDVSPLSAREPVA